MNQQVFKYLSKFATQPFEVDRLIVSAFLNKNKLEVKKNTFLKSYTIETTNFEELGKLKKFILVINKEVKKFGIEELIELFEFAISPADRIINGAIYTPRPIREFIVQRAFYSKRNNIENAKIADIACGCGGFLFTAAKLLKKRTKKSYSDIFRDNIFGLDIQGYSIKRTKLLLSLIALLDGEDKKEYQFNLYKGDALIFNWKNDLNKFDGFDVIIGNPPYVCARNLSEDSKINISKWSVSQSGNPDLYIPFFQIGFENLSENGFLGYITMNSFFKSLNGRSLREYFQEKKVKFKIVDFGTEQIFKSKNTYTCICFIEKSTEKYIKYISSDGKIFPKLEQSYSKIFYSGLDSFTGWNLRDNEIISKIESTGVALGDLFKTRHGIATLKNDIYIFKPVDFDDKYYYLQNGSKYPIEKEICKDIVNTNRLNGNIGFDDLKEKVIFPYTGDSKPKLLEEKFLKDNYPMAFNYLNKKREILSKRDKGKGDYENWFAFGRSQSLEKVANKLFFPKITNRIPNYIINSDDNLLFYNGQAIIGHSEQEMLFIKRIMESRLFWFYIFYCRRSIYIIIEKIINFFCTF